jgi:hypothetical protein
MKVLSNGPVQTRMHEEDGKTIFERVQDCTPIAEKTKALHNEGYHGSSDMRLAASLPMVLVERYCNDNGITFHEFCAGQEHIKRMLNDPALSHFRVWPGRV